MPHHRGDLELEVELARLLGGHDRRAVAENQAPRQREIEVAIRGTAHRVARRAAEREDGCQGERVRVEPAGRGPLVGREFGVADEIRSLNPEARECVEVRRLLRARAREVDRDGVTRDVNRARVLSARSLMGAATAKTENGERIAAAAKVDSFAARIIEANRPFAVVDGDGRIIGEISPRAVIDLFSGRDRARSP